MSEMSVKGKAVQLLSRREHSRCELEQKLLQKGYEEQEIKDALDDLAGNNLLSDARFTESYIRARILRGMGPLKISMELQTTHNIAKEEIINSEPWVEKDWAQMASELRIRKFGDNLPTDIKEKAKQTRFLLQRGFSIEQIRVALVNVDETSRNS